MNTTVANQNFFEIETKEKDEMSTVSFRVQKSVKEKFDKKCETNKVSASTVLRRFMESQVAEG